MSSVDFAPLAAIMAKVAPGTPFETTPLVGGASTRRYFRVTWGDGPGAVAMFVPRGDAPEEIDKSGKRERWPFLEVRDLLAERGVAVPRLYAEDTASGWLLLEDLGDDTLANALNRDPSRKLAFYTRAVSDLARAQSRLSQLPLSSVVASRAFDHELLHWEIDHFREWGLEARGIHLSADDRASFEAIGRRLAERIAGWSRGFTHRDYQSRNLMVKNDELVWIDFQDALMGPRVYDLVALLGDSYQEFDRAFIEARLADFAGAAGLGAADREALTVEFDWVTVQRKLKDAGRFVFIDKTKNNPSFLKFVVPTVKKVSRALQRLEGVDPDMARLATILRRVLPDEMAAS